MSRFKRTKKRQEKLIKEDPEELARELNIILRTAKYATETEAKEAVKRCAARVPKEQRNTLLGK